MDKSIRDLPVDERIRLVEQYHRRAGIRLPNVTVHAIIHAVIENQIALGDEVPVRRTLQRLLSEGLDRHGPAVAKSRYPAVAWNPPSQSPVDPVHRLEPNVSEWMDNRMDNCTTRSDGNPDRASELDI